MSVPPNKRLRADLGIRRGVVPSCRAIGAEPNISTQSRLSVRT